MSSPEQQKWVTLRNELCNSNRKENNISSKDSRQAPLISSVPIEWKSFSKKVIWVLFPNSIPFKQLRHPPCILASNLSYPNTKLFFLLPGDFPLPMVFMIIPFLLSPTVFLPMFSIVIIPFPKRMKLRKSFNNFSKRVLSVLVPARILLLWS
jgi:hypothetical protein